MAWLEGLIGGFSRRKGEIEQQNLRQAELAAARESRIFEHLLQADDPEIKSLALTGLLESANPKKRAKGLRGWVGEMESSPYLRQIQTVINTPIEEETSTLPSRSFVQGVPLAPGIAQSAAMPEENAVEPGQPPPTPTVAVGQGPPAPTALQITDRPPTPTGTIARPREVFASPETLMRRAEETSLRTKRAEARGDVEGDIEGLTASFVAAGADPVSARKRAATLVEQERLRRGGGALAGRYGGVTRGDQVAAGEVDSYGRPLDPNQYYRVQINPDQTLGYIPTVPPGTSSAGVDYNRAAVTLGFRNAAEVPVERRGELEAVAERLTRELGQERAYGAGTGTGQAAFERPADLPTATAAGVPVGTRASDVAGQAVAPEAQRVRRTTAENIKGQLDHIKTLLTPLPKQGELGSFAPGAVVAFRQRSPQYRTAFAELTSAINNIRASLNRTIQANVGTETERDAERALSTIADFEGSLFDPLKGDTQESALARINETLAYLDQVITSIPMTPTPTAPPATARPTAAPPAPTSSGTGLDAVAPNYFVDEQGNLVDAQGNPIRR